MRKFLTFIMAFLVTASFAQQKKVTGTVTAKQQMRHLRVLLFSQKQVMLLQTAVANFLLMLTEGDALDIFFCRHETAEYKNICIIRQLNSAT